MNVCARDREGERDRSETEKKYYYWNLYWCIYVYIVWERYILRAFVFACYASCCCYCGSIVRSFHYYYYYFHFIYYCVRFVIIFVVVDCSYSAHTHSRNRTKKKLRRKKSRAVFRCDAVALSRHRCGARSVYDTIRFAQCERRVCDRMSVCVRVWISWEFVLIAFATTAAASNIADKKKYLCLTSMCSSPTSVWLCSLHGFYLIHV